MNDINKRLAQCFQNVFPDLPMQEAELASAASMSRWDSVAHITLLAAVAEEFGVEFEIEEYEEATSFALIRSSLESKLNVHE